MNARHLREYYMIVLKHNIRPAAFLRYHITFIHQSIILFIYMLILNPATGRKISKSGWKYAEKCVQKLCMFLQHLKKLKSMHRMENCMSLHSSRMDILIYLIIIVYLGDKKKLMSKKSIMYLDSISILNI